MELVANCWDAYATEVRIVWPDAGSGGPFTVRLPDYRQRQRIADNGKGMTRKEFRHIWRTIAYNRVAAQGTTSDPPEDVQGQPRFVFRKNGKGRFASSSFAPKMQPLAPVKSRW